MRKVVIIGATAWFIILLSSFPQAFINAAVASTRQNANAKPSAKIMQLYRAIEVARLLQQSPSQRAAVVKTISYAEAAGLQAIAGRVTTSDGMPLSRIKGIVVAFTAYPDSIASKEFAYVNPDGSYLIEHLVPGNYYVIAQADSYETQYYSQAATFEQAKQVQVVASDTTTGIDFKLQKISPGTGVISGKVTNASGQPLANANVMAFSNDNPFSFANVLTARDGTFRLEALKTGSHIVQAVAEGYITKFYNNRRLHEKPDFVNVVEPNETKNIDFTLTAGGAITGKVTDKSGNPLSGAIVQSYFAKIDSLFGKGFGMAVTEADGAYKISGLESGAYIISAEAWSPWARAQRWYKNVSTPDSAAVLNVQEEKTLAGIDFMLDLPRVAGSISGLVTNAKGEPLPEVSVQGYTLIDSLSLRPQIWIYTNTDLNGRYRLEAPAGEYIVSASAFNSWQSATRWYPNVSTPDSAKPLVVQKNVDLKNIDFQLPLVQGNSVIYGTVRSDDGRPLIGAFVEVTPADDLTKPSWKIWASASTDSLGQFYIPKLPPGQYLVHTQYWEDVRFGAQWHKLADTREQATPVTVQDAEKVGPIDFQLKLRPQYGSIYGRVTADADGSPIGRAYIEVSPLKRNYYTGAPIGFWNWNTTTNDLGEYRLDLLPEGEYLIAVYADGAFEYYENAVVPELAKSIQVIGGDSTQIHFGLSPRREGKGVISGRVMDELKDGFIPIAMVIARPTIVPLVWPKSEMFFTAVTNPFGEYKITGLPDGEYYVMSFAPTYVGKFYENTYDPGEATPVQVTEQKPAEKIDFALRQIFYRNKAGLDSRAGNGVSVIGKVSEGSKKGVANAYVYVLNELRQPVAFTRTNSEGQYEITGVEAGIYRLLASHLNYSSKYNDDANRFAEAKAVELTPGKLEVNFVLAPKSTTGIDEEAGTPIPQTVELYGNYPNPFNPETQIAFGLPAAMRVKIRLFNVLGEEVAVLHDGVLNAGVHRLNWNGRNQAGRQVGSGLYLYRLESPALTLRGKMLLLR